MYHNSAPIMSTPPLWRDKKYILGRALVEFIIYVSFRKLNKWENGDSRLKCTSSRRIKIQENGDLGVFGILIIYYFQYSFRPPFIAHVLANWCTPNMSRFFAILKWLFVGHLSIHSNPVERTHCLAYFPFFLNETCLLSQSGFFVAQNTLLKHQALSAAGRSHILCAMVRLDTKKDGAHTLLARPHPPLCLGLTMVQRIRVRVGRSKEDWECSP